MSPTSDRRPRLWEDMTPDELSTNYWSMAELADLARRLGLSPRGPKPELQRRIERRLRGAPDVEAPADATDAAGRDSDHPITRDTPVVNYKSDSKTRAFFEQQIGPDFHFSYHLNQFRMARKGLTYGDLVDEWLAERDRRRLPGYEAPIAAHGEYNRYIRDFYADKKNKGRPLRDAVASWNEAKRSRGDRRYRPEVESIGE